MSMRIISRDLARLRISSMQEVLRTIQWKVWYQGRAGREQIFTWQKVTRLRWARVWFFKCWIPLVRDDWIDARSFSPALIFENQFSGHTNGCLSYVDHKNAMVFTGDCLFIRGCGRTDFQSGDSGLLYDSVHGKLFTLPEHYKVYPAHDYKGQLFSTIEEEKKFNPRLIKSKEEFIEIMKNLNLARPELIGKRRSDAKRFDILVCDSMACIFTSL